MCMSKEVSVPIPDELAAQVCADTKVGNHMIRGISGGQKKRVTTGAPPLAEVSSNPVNCQCPSLASPYRSQGGSGMCHMDWWRI